MVITITLDRYRKFYPGIPSNTHHRSYLHHLMMKSRFALYSARGGKIVKARCPFKNALHTPNDSSWQADIANKEITGP